jgi:hypothetical protein
MQVLPIEKKDRKTPPESDKKQEIRERKLFDKRLKSLSEEQFSLFPLEAFPERIQNIVNTFWETYQLPIDYHCTAILAAVSTALGNAYAVKYKSREIYPANVWTCIVGPAGIGKSPAMDFGTFPLYNIEDRYRQMYNEEMVQWERKCDEARENNDRLPDAPVSKDIILKDSTVESINMVLEGNPKGVLLDQDELLAWVKGMNAYRKGSDLEYYLSIWSGKPVKVTRTGKATKWIRYPFLSVIGSVQPKMLKELITSDKANNGFFDRILFAYPDGFHVAQESDMEVDDSVYEFYDRLIRWIHDLPNSFEYEEDEFGNYHLKINRIVVPMTSKARKKYKAFRNKLSSQQNNADEESVMGLLSKMKQYCLRLALIIEFLDLACKAAPKEGEDGAFDQVNADFMLKMQVSEKSIDRAMLMVEYFTRTSLKVMNQLESPVAQLPKYQKFWYEELPDVFNKQDAVDLGKKIMKKDENAKLSARTLARLLNNEKHNLFRSLSGKGEYQKLWTTIRTD